MPAMPAPLSEDRKLTYEDYLGFPEDGQRHELLDGEHVVSPAPLEVHQRVSLNLTMSIALFLEETGLGELREAPYGVHLGRFQVVEPDLLVILEQNFDRIGRRGLEGPPDLVIEILSESTRGRDLVRKRRIYARHGVPEYWIVDPDSERVEVYRRAEGGLAGQTSEAGDAGEPDPEVDYERPLVLSADRGDAVETELLPGLTIALTRIFDPGPAARRRVAEEAGEG